MNDNRSLCRVICLPTNKTIEVPYKTTISEQVGLQVGNSQQVILADANGSLMGSWMNKLSNPIRQDMDLAGRKTTSFKLFKRVSFKDQYVASIFMPHTDLGFFPGTAKRRAARKQSSKQQ